MKRTVRPLKSLIGSLIFLVGLMGPGLPSKAGTPVGVSFSVSALGDAQVFPSVAYSSERQEYLVVWHNEWPGNKDIYGQRVAKNGTSAGPWFAISIGAGDRYYPDVAYNSKRHEYLVAWEHKVGAEYSIRAQRVSASGQLLGGEVVVASPPTMHDEFKKPAVDYAYTSDKYLVVWESHWEFGVNIECQKLSSTGTVEGSSQTVSGAGVLVRGQPDVAYNRRRNEYLVVWQQSEPSPGIHNIYARRVRGDGTPMAPESIHVAFSVGNQIDPAVAAVPTAGSQGQYLVVWKDLHYGQGYIDATRIGGQGDPIWPTFFIQQEITLERGSPAVAGNERAQEYLVVWRERSAPPVVFDGIGARSVPTAGDVLGEARGLGGLAADHPAVGSGPLGDFLVAFDDLTASTDRDIRGHLWGNRTYLPATMRHR